MSRLLGPAIAAAVLLTVTLASSRHADAYPQYTLSRQSTCSACHVSPAGGGLLQGMGPFTSEDDSTWGGDGGFLEGKVTLPEWLNVGGDTRFAFGGNDSGGGFGGAAFPMQFESYASATKGALTGYATLGLVRPNEDSVASIIQTCEYWVMWRPDENGLYVRAGCFMPVYGLRLAEHMFYMRRFGGAPLYGEAYGVGVGWMSDGLEAHATAFLADRLRESTERGDGVAAYVEKRLTDTIAVGAQGRFADGDEDQRIQGGVIGKYWLESAKLLLQAEATLTRQSFTADYDRSQFVGQLLGTWFFKTGFFLDVGLGQYDPDLSLKGQARTSIDANLHWFPWAHGELVLMTRLQSLGLGDGGPGSGFTLLQLHYRL